MTETPVPVGKEFEPLVADVIKEALERERFAAGEIRKLEAKVKEWKEYRQQQKDLVIRALAGNTVGTYQGVPLVTVIPKAQWNGTRLQAEYPDLFREYTKIQATEYLDWESLAQNFPDIAARYQVVTFVNKVE